MKTIKRLVLMTFLSAAIAIAAPVAAQVQNSTPAQTNSISEGDDSPNFSWFGLLGLLGLAGLFKKNREGVVREGAIRPA